MSEIRVNAYGFDSSFFATVEAQLSEALVRAAELEAGAEAIGEMSPTDRLGPLQRVVANLEGWETRLNALARLTADSERELLQQEESLRSWFQAAADARTRLGDVAHRTSAAS